MDITTSFWDLKTITTLIDWISGGESYFILFYFRLGIISAPIVGEANLLTIAVSDITVKALRRASWRYHTRLIIHDAHYDSDRLDYPRLLQQPIVGMDFPNPLGFIGSHGLFQQTLMTATIAIAPNLHFLSPKSHHKLRLSEGKGEQQ